MSIFTGFAPAMITAFKNDKIDYNSQKNIIEHLISGKVDAIVVLGTTGEPSTMTLAEREELLDFTVKVVAKRVPVIAGSGGNNTAESINFSKKCEALGADALMIVTPYYNKCTQNGIVAHFKAISDAVNLPIIAYNVPSRTGVNIIPETAVKLAELKNIKAIKEASGSMEQISDVIRLTRGKLDVYSGDDALTVPAISLGAKGVISVAANASPTLIANQTHLALKGDFKAATEVNFKIAPFVKLLFSEVNPIPLKKAMEYLKLCNGEVRLPLTQMEEANSVKLKKEMQGLGLIK